MNILLNTNIDSRENIEINMNASKSPDRYTFQLERLKNRAEENGKEFPEHYEDIWKTAKEQDEANLIDPTWQKDNMEYDLRSTEWILDKVRTSDSYAQNLYAAMCNNEFIKLDVMPILKDQRWSCSWRHAGGIVADMLEKGDYIDWYCSGSGGFLSYTDETRVSGYVSESIITDEIYKDLKKLGWIPVDYQDNDTAFT
jgi:hypothetical protein